MKTYFSPYKIKWIILIPSKGIATKHDHKRLDRRFYFNRGIQNNCLLASFPTEQHAINTLSSIKQVRLDKQYTAYIISDKQFGLSDGINWQNILTTKQKRNAVTI